MYASGSTVKLTPGENYALASGALRKCTRQGEATDETHLSFDSAVVAYVLVIVRTGHGGADPATARFTYLASPEGPGVPGGLPNAYVLHFGMQGMFTITELPNNEGDITQADFILVGNEAAFQNNPEGRAWIEATARQILLYTHV